MTAEQQFTTAWRSLRELNHRAAQLKAASHRYHDQTGEYEQAISELSPKQMLLEQSRFNRYDQTFHDVMNNYERQLKEHTALIQKLKPFGKKAVAIRIAGKTIQVKLSASGDLVLNK